MNFWKRKWRAIDGDTGKDLGFNFDDRTDAVSYYKRTGATILNIRRFKRTITVHIPQDLKMAGHFHLPEAPQWLTPTR